MERTKMPAYMPVERMAPPQSAASAQDFVVDLERYRFAARYVTSRQVLDIASGEGYGAAFLADEGRAASIVGIDCVAEVVTEAQRRYGSSKVSFAFGTAERIPIPDCSVDVAVSIETYEHVTDPHRLLLELRRVTRPGGVIILSTPRNETDARFNPSNPYHVREYSSAEFASALRAVFRDVELFSQVTSYADDLLPGDGSSALRSTIRRFVPQRLRSAIRGGLGSRGLTVSSSVIVAGIVVNSTVQLAVCRP